RVRCSGRATVIRIIATGNQAEGGPLSPIVHVLPEFDPDDRVQAAACHLGVTKKGQLLRITFAPLALSVIEVEPSIFGVLEIGQARIWIGNEAVVGNDWFVPSILNRLVQDFLVADGGVDHVYIL